MLTGYYDGSGQSHDSKFVTLAGVIASASVWHSFNRQWRAVLQRYQLSEFHMTDAISLKKAFSPTFGWSHEKVQELIWELWAVFGRFRATDQFRLGTNLVGSSCTISMEDYRKAKAELRHLRSPEAICTQFCVGVTPRDIDSDIEHPEISLIFDQNENFRHPIYRNWQQCRSKRWAGWPRQIKMIEKASSSDTPPLQAADLLAWTMNTNRPEYAYGKVAAVLMIEHYNKKYDYETIKAQFQMDR